jgi:hypothetical protein
MEIKTLLSTTIILNLIADFIPYEFYSFLAAINDA